MAAPDPTDAVPFWAQVTAGITLIATVLAQAWRFIREWTKDEGGHVSHVVMEHAELADLTPLLDVAKKLGEIYPLLEANVKQSDEMLAILRRLEREREIERQVEERLRDERLREADHEARRRDR